MQSNRARVVCLSLAAAALTALSFAGAASAKLTGAFTIFQNCPYKNTEVRRCMHAVTTGGEIVLGTKKVTIEKQVTLQGGASKAVEKFATFFDATNGVTLSKVPQNVPGGLLGIVPPEKSPWLVKALSAFFFENGLTGVTSTLELARPAKEIKISEVHLAEGQGVAMKLPVKFKMDNPFLGKNCYVGSSTTPVWWELTTGKTAPPPPNTSISGSIGEVEFLEEGQIARIKGAKLVDNSWSAPGASGCGGILGFLVNPILNAQVGLPAAKGKNTAVLVNTINTSPSLAVKINDEENP